MNINDIIIKPMITEKTSVQMGVNVYTFEVHPKATKTDIKRAIEIIFAKSNAKVNKIAIQNIKQKAAKMGKYEGFKKGFKKAIVYLSAGSIPIYGNEGVEDTSKKKRKTLKIIDTDKFAKIGEGD